MRIKVCGLTDVNQVAQLDELGIQFGGFIFYPRSPRYVYNSLTSQQIKKIKGKINKVGVFVNADQEDVLRTIDDCGLYLAQLHGDETPKYCERISEYITVVKAFQVSSPEEIAWRIHEYQDVVDMFLFDTPGIGYGGTGKKFDWRGLKDVDIKKPFFLSGGIGPEDDQAVKDFTNFPIAKDLFSLDINSRFEIKPGVKDLDKVQKFANQINYK
jgi:phosphoribosylanthranilate isomerase